MNRRRSFVRGAGALAASTMLPALDARAALKLERPRGDLVPLGYFGVHVHDPFKHWPEMPVGRYRLWDTRTNWFDLQPSKDRFEFDRLDRIVDMCAQRGVQVVMALGMTPQWASARPEEASPYNRPGAAAEPARIEDWQHFVGVLGRRYKGRIRHYELWNEVNAGAGFFSGTPESLFALQRAAYLTLKEVDSGIRFIAPSSVGETDAQLAWHEHYLDLMQGQFADAIAYHFYTTRKPPEAIVGLVGKVRDIARRTGNGSLPIWNTESGYRIEWGANTEAKGVASTWPNLAPELASAYVARSLLLGWIAGLDSYFWYSFDNKLLGMAPFGETRSEMTGAWSAMANCMVGSSVVSVHELGTAILCELQRGRAKFWLAWSSAGTAQEWSLPLSCNADFARPLGADSSTPIGRRTVSLGARPTILHKGLLQLGTRG